MARLGVDTLLDAVARALDGAVLPAVQDRFARGQLYAAIDVLRNLRDRVELRADLLAVEADSAAAALAAAVEALDAAGAGPAAAATRAALAAVPAAPPAARADALRAALVAAYERLATLGDGVAAPARAALAAHLAAQAMRDITLLKPSLLAEISRG
jgi:hypothetical protein